GLWMGYQVRLLQLFKDYHLMLLYELFRLLMVKVPSLISHLAMGPGYGFPCLLPPMTSPFLAREGLLLALQISLSFAIVARRLNKCPIREGCKVGDTEINPNFTLDYWQGFRLLDLGGEHDVPLPCFVLH